MFTNFENMRNQPDKTIRFFFLSRNITLKNRDKLKSFLADIIRKEGKELIYANFIFCSDAYLLDINRKYLKHNYYTDIVTFDLSSDRNFLEAEIYISLDRVRENAGILKKPISEELIRVVFHGILHLCGYNDKNEKQRLKMREMEDSLLQAFKTQ
jgi:probable rRNA maturation factor